MPVFSYPGISSFKVETSKGSFNEISIPNAFSVGNLGTPKLPATKELIEIPFGATYLLKLSAIALLNISLVITELTSS